MSAGWNTLDTENNSLNIDLSENEDMDNHGRDYRTDKIVSSFTGLPS